MSGRECHPGFCGGGRRRRRPSHSPKLWPSQMPARGKIALTIAGGAGQARHSAGISHSHRRAGSGRHDFVECNDVGPRRNRYWRHHGSRLQPCRCCRRGDCSRHIGRDRGRPGCIRYPETAIGNGAGGAQYRMARGLRLRDFGPGRGASGPQSAPARYSATRRRTRFRSSSHDPDRLVLPSGFGRTGAP